MASMTIGQVTKLAGVGVETIRFYERDGLIEKPPRRPSGYRQYPPVPWIIYVSSDGPRNSALH